MNKLLRIPLPFWIGLVIAIPLVGMFVISLAAAAVIAALAAGAYYLLRPASQPLPRRNAEPTSIDEIELSPADYRRLPASRDEERR